MELGPLPSSPRWNSLPEGRKHQSLMDPSPWPSNRVMCNSRVEFGQIIRRMFSNNLYWAQKMLT